MDAVNAQVANPNNPDLTPQEIQPLVVAAAQNTIDKYDGSNDAPMFGDYTNAGVIGVTETNLNAVDAQVLAH